MLGEGTAPAPGEATGDAAAPMTPEQALAKLQALAEALVKSRTEAMNGRAASGIEKIWDEDAEHYEGVDELTKSSERSSNQSKPPGQLAGTAAANQATEFVNITRPYVDAAAAKAGDILIPTDDKGWSIKPTPIPELLEKAKGKLPLEVIEGMAHDNVPEATAVQVAQTEQQAAQAILDEAKDRAKAAEKRIEDWQIESQYHGELRKVIDTAARLGTGVIKGPLSAKKRQQMFRNGALVIDMETKPVSREVSPRNCFPDPACGTSIHNGRYHWERDHITPKQLQSLKGTPGYIDAQIDVCLAEGPQKKNLTNDRRTSDGRYLEDKELFEIWYFYGYATQEDMAAAGCPCKPGAPLLVPAVFTMVNDRVVKGDMNLLDTGEFPYDYFPWQRRENQPWGLGVARQIRTAQRIVTAATRVMLTNAGRSAGPIILRRRGVIGADGTNDIVPWKEFVATGNDNVDDVRKLMEVYELPDRQAPLQAIINYGLKIAEDTTGLPLLLQGQAGSAPETLGGQQLVDRNASGVLRRIARTFDDCITEPHTRRYYTYLLMYGESDYEKGEFVIDARGSTALVEREITRQETTGLLELSLNPQFKLSPAKTMEQKLRADNRNPKDFQYTDEELKQLQGQGQHTDPRVQVAEITAQSKEKIEAARIQVESAEKEKDRQMDLIVQQILEHIEAMKLGQAKEISMDQLKAELAGIAIKVRAESNANALAVAADVHKHETPGAAHPPLTKPPFEPAGRAPAGEAYAR
jgi:hypothetical protein